MIKRNYGTKMKQCTRLSIYIHCTCIKNYINDNEPYRSLSDFMPNTHENELLL